MENEKEKLKREINEAKVRLKQLEEQEKKSKKSLAIKNLDEFTAQEKIDFFDKMYNIAKSELKDHEKGKRRDDDHYGWEEYIVIVARNKQEFWKYWNSIDS